MRHLLHLFGCFTLLLVALTTSVTAQPDNVLLVEQTADARFDADAVRAAMAPLAADGVRVAAYFMQTGDAADFLARLRDDGLGNGSGADADVIAVYVAVNTQYSELRWGANFNNRLRGANIRSAVTNPALRDGDFTRAFTDTFAAIEAALAGDWVNPSTAPGAAVSAPAAAVGGGLGGLLGQIGNFIFGLFSESLAVVLVIGGMIFFFIRRLFTGEWGSGGTDDSSSDHHRWNTWNSWGSDSGSSSNSSSDSGGSDGGSWSD